MDAKKRPDCLHWAQSPTETQCVFKRAHIDGHYMDWVRETELFTIYLIIKVWYLPGLTGYLSELIYQCMNYTYVQLSKSKTNVTNPSSFTSKLKCSER